MTALTGGIFLFRLWFLFIWESNVMILSCTAKKCVSEVSCVLFSLILELAPVFDLSKMFSVLVVNTQMQEQTDFAC